MSRSSQKVEIEPYSELFRTEHLKADLKGRSVRGGVVTISAQIIKFGLTLVANIVLARLLTPEAYGLVGMVLAITGFMTLFQDLGLAMATVQKDEINHRQVSTLFWINLGVSLAITLVTMAIASMIAQLYREPRLLWITIALATGITLSGLGTQHAALLKRQMQYTKLVVNDIVSQFIGVTAGIIAARYGLDYWSLVIYPLVTAGMQTIGFWSLCRWFPGLPVWNHEIQSMLKFGGNLTGFGVINYLARNVDNILIGKYWGAYQLGLYAKAYQLLLLPLNQINAPIMNVAVPVLSRLSDAPERYRRTYLRILEKLILLTMPLVVFMIVSADWLIRLLLGDQWTEARIIFIWLAIAGIFQPIAGSVGWIFITQGQTDRMFKWGIIGASTSLIAFLVGLPWGAVGVAASYATIWTLITMPLLFFYVGRVGPVRTKDFYITAAPIAFASLLTTLLLSFIRNLLMISDPFIGCLFTLVMTSIIYLSVLFALPQGRLACQDLKHLVVMFRAT